MYQENLTEIVGKYNIEMIVYFGSYGTEFYNRESDIDIAFLSTEYLTGKDKLEFLEKLIHYHKKSEIDLVDLRTADPILRYEIAVNGRVLYEKEENFFEKHSLFYIKSFYEHKPVLEDRMRKIAISVEEVLKAGRIMNQFSYKNKTSPT